MSYHLSYTFDFIRAYYDECADPKITCEMAYEKVEARYYDNFRTYIERGVISERKFANYASFRAALAYHLKKNRKKI